MLVITFGIKKLILLHNLLEVSLLPSVAISPVATFAVLRYANAIPVDFRDTPEEVTVIAIGLIALYFVQFPFITFPMAVAGLVFAEVDLSQMIYGPQPSIGQHAQVSVIFGFLELLLAYGIDRLNYKADFSFWIYIYGMFAFWGGLTTEFVYVYQNSFYLGLFYLFVNIALLYGFVRLNRIIFLLAGGAGVATYVAQEMFLYGSLESNSWFSVLFGAVVTLAAYIVDTKQINSIFPFWGYLFGVLTFESGLSFLFGWPVYTSQYFKLFYCVVNIGMALLYIPTQRDVFIFAGGFGVLWYAEYLVNHFAPNYALPIFLTVLGLALIGVAVYFSSRKIMARRRAAQ